MNGCIVRLLLAAASVQHRFRWWCAVGECGGGPINDGRPSAA